MTDLVYVFDGYCGWCWGFHPAVRELAADDGLAVTALPGSLFTGSRRAPLSAFGFIRQANQQVTALTGVEFGAEFEATLDEGSLVPDSDDAARLWTALRAVAGPGRDVELVTALQAAFFVEGRSLSDPGTATTVAASLGLDPGATAAALADPEVAAAARTAQQQARALGVDRYPTLLVRTGPGRTSVGPATSSAADLRAELAALRG
ncbi:DsbA family protein [Kineococcus gynurae]|uniref:DsbA family protein n=1 Tax=Kineococcus gynurae TaxID=452979 RepID=A0ABV5LQI2_9ACTN